MTQQVKVLAALSNHSPWDCSRGLGAFACLCTGQDPSPQTTWKYLRACAHSEVNQSLCLLGQEQIWGSDFYFTGH